jgi:hypothetical protein
MDTNYANERKFFVRILSSPIRADSWNSCRAAFPHLFPLASGAEDCHSPYVPGRHSDG